MTAVLLIVAAALTIAALTVRHARVQRARDEREAAEDPGFAAYADPTKRKGDGR
jgi:hypothetical protein